MVNYHADDSFDNMLIDDNLRKLWQNDVAGNFRNLEPIKNWEKAERYQVATNLKMTFKEKRKILPKLTSTLKALFSLHLQFLSILLISP